MATLKVTEGAVSGMQNPVLAQVMKLKGVTQNPVTFTGTAGVSAAFQSTTRIIRVVSDANCAVKVGASDVAAVATDTQLQAGKEEYFFVDGGDYISAITI